ncbi:MAG: hypothetical protein MJY77_02340 [Bacteroidaceae bacterium]|nr:hypothetical protein [Bacteroidaceae bacterium]
MMYYIIVALSVFIAAVAQMLLKKGAMMPHTSIVREYLNPWVIGGYLIMGISLLVNVFAMSHGVKVKEVSIIESLSYLFVPLLSLLLFKEKMTARKIISILIIITGITIFFY